MGRPSSRSSVPKLLPECLERRYAWALQLAPPQILQAGKPERLASTANRLRCGRSFCLLYRRDPLALAFCIDATPFVLALAFCIDATPFVLALRFKNQQTRLETWPKRLRMRPIRLYKEPEVRAVLDLVSSAPTVLA
jgi:hypothetical protein